MKNTLIISKKYKVLHLISTTKLVVKRNNQSDIYYKEVDEW